MTDPILTTETEVQREKLVTKPRIEIDLAEVERLAGQGLSQAEISLSLGISEATFYDRKRESEEFRDAIARGKAAGTRKASKVLDDLLGSTDQRVKLDAAKFYLARRSGWSETTEIAGKEGAPPVSVMITSDDAKL